MSGANGEEPLGGGVAIDVARQLAEPTRALRDRLGLVVDHLERYVATATGPEPYPWRSLLTLRQDLAAAYLEATQLARRLEELDRALREEPAGAIDLEAAVDLGLRLASHHLGTAIELLVDLGRVPAVRGSAGAIALVVAQLVEACARSARAAAGSSLTVRVVEEDGSGVVVVADNGAGDGAAVALGELARAVVAPWGGSADAASQDGRGCSFELRLVLIA